ncbi:MAG: hypothetical protein ABW107_02385, partial [Candidatus Thiodiazotropha sp. 6PLUC5]
MNIQQTFLRLSLTIILILLLPTTWAEESANDENKVTPEPIPQTLKSPRATMETFLHAMND